MNVERLLLACLLAFASTGSGHASQTLETAYRTNGKEVQAVFESVRQVLQTSSAVIQVGRDEISYGTVVSPDGFILTKASEIEGREGLSVIVDRQEYKEPRVVAADPAWDVSLLKIEATGLTPVRLSDDPEPQRGTWVVANGATSRLKRLPQVGIISANAREVPPDDVPMLGVTLDEVDGALEVSELHEEGGAMKAGMQVGDRVLAVNGQEIAERVALAEILSKSKPGEKVTLTLQRDGAKLDLEVELVGRSRLFGEEPSRNDMMSGLYSGRRYDFPRVIQHDIIANAKTVGGPLLDLDGRCVGMNIARVNRCETFAIPAAELKSLVERLIRDAGAP